MHDHFSQHPYWTLALSLFPLSSAIYGTVTGRVSLTGQAKTWSRADDPVYFWFALACQYGIFVFLVVTAIAAISN
jgi:hypothetical protein